MAAVIVALHLSFRDPPIIAAAAERRQAYLKAAPSPRPGRDRSLGAGSARRIPARPARQHHAAGHYHRHRRTRRLVPLRPDPRQGSGTRGCGLPAVLRPRPSHECRRNSPGGASLPCGPTSNAHTPIPARIGSYAHERLHRASPHRTLNLARGPYACAVVRIE